MALVHYDISTLYTCWALICMSIRAFGICLSNVAYNERNELERKNFQTKK